MAQAGTVWVDVRGDTKGLLADISSAARGAGSAFSPLGVGKTVLGDIGQAAGVAAIAVGGIAAAAVKASTEFNASMSGVGAVAGATAAEMELLREAALEAGAATVFSASEAAVAEQELVKAGVSVSEVLGGALTGSLSLAAAGQLELGKAAEISAQAMNIFGLAGEDVGYIADVLAAGANKSAADVGQLGDALRQGGLVASQLGIGLEDTIGALSLFADNALIGSDAGTSFKTMLQRLVPQSKEQSKAMAAIGLSFFDAKGEFVGLEEAAQRLQDSMAGLTEEQRASQMTTIFGSDAVRAANLLYKAGGAGIREYTAAVADEGAAARMAAEQLNNLKGDLEEFSGSTETALIRLGQLFDSTNRSLVQGATGFVNVFNDFATTPAWAAIEANVRDLGVGVGGVFDGISDRLEDFLGGISAGEVDRAFDRVTGAVAQTREAVEGLEPVIAGVGLAFSTMALRSIPFIGSIVPALSPITGLLGGLVLGSEEGRDALAGLGSEAADLAKSVGPQLTGALSELADELSVGLASVLEDVGGAAIDAAEVLGPVLGDAISELAPPIGDLIVALGELVAEVLPHFADLAGTVVPPAVDILGLGITVAAEAVEVLTDNVWLLVPALAAFAAVKHGDTIASLAGAFKAAGDQAGHMWRSVGDIAATRGVSRVEALGGVARASGKDVKGLASNLVSSLNPAVIGVTAAIAAGAYAYTTWRNNINEVKEAGEALSEALIEQGENVLPRLARQLDETLDREGWTADFDKTSLSIAAVSEAINENVGDMDRFRQTWNDAGKSLIIFRREGQEIPAGIRPIIETLFGLADSGAISGDELNNVIDAMVDVDKNARTTGDSVGFMAEQLKTALADEGVKLAGAALRDFNTAMDDNAPLNDRRDALARLAEQYPEVAAAAGVAVGNVSDSTNDLALQAARAAGEIRGLVVELDELSGVERDVDKAQRDLAASVARVNESIIEGGGGIDYNTEAGRRNADAIQGMVEAAERLAEAQARTDTTGKSSSETFKQLQRDLFALFQQGQLNEAEYLELLDTYDLTPEEIETKIIADADEAKAKLEDLTRRILDTPGVTEEQKVILQAALNEGKYQAVEAFLNQLARNRTAVVEVLANISPGVRNILDPGGIIRTSGIKTVKGRASGGPVWPGEDFIVGEEGPELMQFGASGRVVDAKTTSEILAAPSGNADPALMSALLERLDRMGADMLAIASRPTFGQLNQYGVAAETAPEDTVRAMSKARILVGA